MPTLKYDRPKLVNVEWAFDEYRRAYDMPEKHNEPIRQHLRENIVRYGGSDWYAGIKSHTEAELLLAEGWRDGSDRLSAITRELTPPTIRCKRRRGSWEDAGDDLSVDRAMTGQWDNAWRISRRQDTRGPTVVELNALIGGANWRTADALFWKGATCAILTDLLEDAGYRVRVVGSMVAHAKSPGRYVPLNYPTDSTFKTDVVIKEADEPLRLDALAGVLCHAGVFRTIGFWAMMHSTPRTFDTGCAYWGIQEWSDIQHELDAAGDNAPEVVRINSAWKLGECRAEINRVLKLLSE